jgi:hypothetical protein
MIKNTYIFAKIKKEKRWWDNGVFAKVFLCNLNHCDSLKYLFLLSQSCIKIGYTNHLPIARMYTVNSI